MFQSITIEADRGIQAYQYGEKDANIVLNGWGRRIPDFLVKSDDLNWLFDFGCTIFLVWESLRSIDSETILGQYSRTKLDRNIP